ncbi:tRNA pseudouridine(38-40) synthase TruA [Croceiramulus getboli]|nr:tRNA pseudouridine(38-40) synthase TruA [Flavobacteriaceae bacterium YJPT1-3]
MRFFIKLAYHGKPFSGWQIQPDQPSVQETLQQALSTLLRKPIGITGAGRTDTGVHASQMYAHFDLDGETLNSPLIKDLVLFVHRLNAYLPGAISIRNILPVLKDAHARFDATQRTYEYHIARKKDPFAEELAWHYSLPLDIERMNSAAQILMQYQDFECFSKSKTDVKTYLCDLKSAKWELHQDRLLFTVSADRFLRNMVRAIVGTLIEVGLKKLEVADMHRIVKSKDRGKAGASVPAHGLFLTQIDYPQAIFK